MEFEGYLGLLLQYGQLATPNKREITKNYFFISQYFPKKVILTCYCVNEIIQLLRTYDYDINSPLL